METDVKPVPESRSPLRPTELDLININSPEENTCQKSPIKSHKCSDDEIDEDKTIHGFNKCNNVTVIGTDGSDSGVELCNGANADGDCREIILQRALSSTSGGGYSSSSCGNVDDGTLAFSCDSSIVSCCSNYEDAFDVLSIKNSSLLEDLTRHAALVHNDERTSENGSESSSICGGQTPKSSLHSSRRLNSSSVKKKVAVTEPTRQSRNRINASEQQTPLQSRSRSKSNSSRMLSSTSSKTGPSSNSTTPRARRDKSSSSEQKSSFNQLIVATKNNSANNKICTARSKVDTNITKRDSSLSRCSASKLVKSRTPVSTPSDDGRWPSNVSRSNQMVMSRSTRGSNILDSAGNAPILVSKSTRFNVDSKLALDKYATLPRRRDKDKTLVPENSSVRAAMLTQSKRDSLSSKYLPPYPKKKTTKIKIYHEMSIQTALTAIDLENVLNGGSLNREINPAEREKVTCGIQVDLVQQHSELLEKQIKDILEKNSKLTEENQQKDKELKHLESQLQIEKEEKQAAKEELERNAQRVLAMVHNNDDVSKQGCDDSLLALEHQFKKAGEIVVKQEREISDLQSLCRSLQRDLHKSLETQEALLKQQKDMEIETAELKEFMQAEKSTLSEVLRDTEEDVRVHISKLNQKEYELQRQQEECKHLVRVSEQRRQENLTLQARLGYLEARSRELLLQQGAAVSGTAVALSGLIGRLESLVTQLIQTYNISEQDLEDSIYHNEAYSNSESSENSPTKTVESRRNTKRTPSPKRGASFVSAVINAIRNAAAQTAIRANSMTLITDSEDTDSGELLDSETEPVLMMENVLEDVVMPDTHSHNMVSSTHSLNGRMAHSTESLNNLSQSIIARQQLEHSTAMDKMSPPPALTLVDQVIDVDNMVTKLLKVLRIIQIENDGFIDELQDERAQLMNQIEKQQEACKAAVKQLQDWEQMGARLKLQLSETSKNLESKTQELTETKNIVQQQRIEIERLNEDICKLSSLCSQTELKLRAREEEANATLKQWQETGKLPTADVLARLVTARHEIPTLKEQLLNKEKELAEITEKFSASKQVMTESWNQAISETRRQYEAIDAALETLLGIQNVVEQCPPLAKLQKDLEEISFQCASSVPLLPSMVASDFNANANHGLETSPQTPINGTA